MARRAFVCHSSVDSRLAERIVEGLEGAGFPCWIAPRDVVSGVNYPRQLVRAIQDCEVFVVLVTPSSAQSDHVLRELEQAIRHQRPVLPVVIDDAVSDDLDYYLGALHRILGSEETVVPSVVRHFLDAESEIAAGSFPDSSAEEPRGDVIRVGVIPWPPFSCHGADGEPPSGLFVDLLDQYAVETGIGVHYLDITNDAARSGLLSGELDAVACLYKTPRRESEFDFAACLFASTIGAVVRSDDDRIKSHGDLMKPDVRLAVCRGEIGAELAVDMFGARRGSSRLVELDTTDVQNIGRMVEVGVADVAITDNITCRMIADSLGPSVRHEFSTFPLYVGHIGLLMKKGRDELRDHLNERLNDLRLGAELTATQRQLEQEYSGMLQVL